MAAARVKSSLDNWLNEVSDLSKDECESGAAARRTDRRRMSPLNVIRTSDLLKGEWREALWTTLVTVQQILMVVLVRVRL